MKYTFDWLDYVMILGLSCVIFICIIEFFLYGFGGNFIKDVLNKSSKSDFVSINKFLFYNTWLYLIFIFIVNYHAIYIDNLYVFQIYNIEVSVPEEIINYMNSELGSWNAFLIGCKLGGAFVNKDLINMKSKLVTVFVTGSITLITDQVANFPEASHFLPPATVGEDSSSSVGNFFINSPLESTAAEILNQTLKADLTEILSDNLFVNLSIVYLLCILVLVLTIRFVVNHEFILNKIKSFNSALLRTKIHPFGKVLYYILSKLFNVWKNSSNFWIYFILFSVIWCCFASAYAIYWCLVAISMSN